MNTNNDPAVREPKRLLLQMLADTPCPKSWCRGRLRLQVDPVPFIYCLRCRHGFCADGVDLITITRSVGVPGLILTVIE